VCGRPSPRARHGAPLRAISAGAKNGAYALIRCSLSRPVSSRACVGSVWAWGGEGAFWARGLGGKLFPRLQHTALSVCNTYSSVLQQALGRLAKITVPVCNTQWCPLQQPVGACATSDRASCNSKFGPLARPFAPERHALATRCAVFAGESSRPKVRGVRGRAGGREALGSGGGRGETRPEAR